MYGKLLILLLLAVGLYFTLSTGFVQLRLFGEALHVVSEKPEKNGAVSSFGALMVSTASRVGTGNIVGVSMAICIGGCGSVFWMWIISIIGGATGFVESTLAQIYKRRDSSGTYFGGPACYIEAATGRRWPSVLFCICLIATYGVGFNMLSSYNLQSAFSGYGFYDKEITPALIGAVLAVLCLFCLLGGGRRIVSINEALVPIMGFMYVLTALIVILRNRQLLPIVFTDIFRSAFDLRAIFSGFAGSCLMYGVKRGLFSNEAGIGSAPNAAAAADVSHPVKQGLVQMLSVFIDTLLCSATALMCLCSGVTPAEDLAGMPYVQAAVAHNFGPAGTVFVTIAMVLFAFTTLLGDFFYIDNCLTYILRRRPAKHLADAARLIVCAVTFAGCVMPMGFVWDVADVLMGIMCLINLPAILKLGGAALRCLSDYTAQRKRGVDPVFTGWKPDSEKMECWK